MRNAHIDLQVYLDDEERGRANARTPETPSVSEEAWEQLANDYLYMLHTAVKTGLRFRNKRGRWKWHVYPREYLAVTRQLADAPAEILEAVREAEKQISEVS